MLKTKARQAVDFVRKTAAETNDHLTTLNRFFGIGGKFMDLFPGQADRVAFIDSPEYREIMAILDALPGTKTAADFRPASGKFMLRLPQSLHRALVKEAEEEGVSLNQLCVSKLSAQLRAVI